MTASGHRSREQLAAAELPGFEDVFAQLEAATGADFAASGGVGDADAAGEPRDEHGFAAVEGALAEERGLGAWLASRSTTMRWIFGILGVSLALLLGLLTRRPDLLVYPRLRYIVELGVPLGLLLLALGSWLRPLHKAPPKVDLRPLLWPLLLITPLVLALLPVAHVAHEASTAGLGDDLIKRAMGCLIWGSLVGLPAGIVALALGRGAAPVGGRRRLFDRFSLLAALLGGVAGTLALHLHCPLTGRMHLLLGHAPVPVLAAALALGVVAGARLLRRGRRGRA